MKCNCLSLSLILFILLFSTKLYSQETAIVDFIEDGVWKTKIRGLNFTDSEQLEKYVHLYKKKRQRKVNRKVVVFGGHTDAYNIWFDSSRFFTFMNEAKEFIEGPASKPTGHKLSGIRFYYALYPKDDNIINEDYQRSHTLVIVPTERCLDGTCPENHDVMENVKGKKKVLAFFVSKPGIHNEPMNNGTLCPPNNCDGTEIK